MAISNLRRAFRQLCARAGLGTEWTTYELRHSFVSLVADQLDDLVKVADLAGHIATRTTEGYRHQVCSSIPHALEAWNSLLDPAGASPPADEIWGPPMSRLTPRRGSCCGASGLH